MKHLTIFLLALSFLAAHIQPVAVYVWFTANQATIAATSCVQRAKPKNCCVGKCQLRKALNNTKQQTAQAQLRFLEVVTLVQVAPTNIERPLHYSSPLQPGVYTLGEALGQYSQVFQPPRA